MGAELHSYCIRSDAIVAEAFEMDLQQASIIDSLTFRTQVRYPVPAHIDILYWRTNAENAPNRQDCLVLIVVYSILKSGHLCCSCG